MERNGLFGMKIKNLKIGIKTFVYSRKYPNHKVDALLKTSLYCIFWCYCIFCCLDFLLVGKNSNNTSNTGMIEHLKKIWLMNGWIVNLKNTGYDTRSNFGLSLNQPNNASEVHGYAAKRPIYNKLCDCLIISERPH